MRGREILRRLDAHMERGEELMARSNAHMDRGNAHMERGNELMERSTQVMLDVRRSLDRLDEDVRLTREEVRLSRQSRDDLRSFIREMIVRMERTTRAQVAELRDLREEGRAQQGALLRLIDRMDRFGPGEAG
jgi:hypothetical protein